MSSAPLTLTYKTVKDKPILLDVYPPVKAGDSINAGEIAAVLWFHGGGLTFGSRTTFFPKWLQSTRFFVTPLTLLTIYLDSSRQ